MSSHIPKPYLCCDRQQFGAPVTHELNEPSKGICMFVQGGPRLLQPPNSQQPQPSLRLGIMTKILSFTVLLKKINLEIKSKNKDHL